MSVFSGPYAGFVGGSYALVAMVVIALVGATLIDHRRQKRKLCELERAGVTRRSAHHASDAA